MNTTQTTKMTTNTNNQKYYAAGVVDDGRRGFGSHWMRVAAVATRANDAWVSAKEQLLSERKSVRRVFCAPVSAWEYREIGRQLAAGNEYILALPEAA